MESEHLRAVFAAGVIADYELTPDPADPQESVIHTDHDVDSQDEEDEADLPVGFAEPYTLEQLVAAGRTEIVDYFRILYE